MSLNKLVNEGVRNLKPYIPGKNIDELKRELHLTRITKLASNENPKGATPKISETWSSLNVDLARYPDGGAYRLKQALAQHLKVEVNQITVGNGSEEVIGMLFKAFVNQTDNIVVSKHAFMIYAILAQAIGASVNEVDPKNYANDLDLILQVINKKTKLVCIANPNNPTGTRVEKDQLLAFLNKIPSDVLVLLDEAYAEYNQDTNYLSGLDCLSKFKNLIVTRTFSKAYGLASVRCGYAVTSPEIADYLNRVRPPFNVNSMALAMCEVAISDQEYIKQSYTFNEFQKQQFYQACEERDIHYIESYCNFVTIATEQTAKQVFEDLLHKGVIIRPLTGYRMPNHIRVSLGTEQEMQHFWQAYDEMNV